MKKFFGVLCFLAILCVAYLAVTQARGGETPTMADVGAGAEKLTDQVKGMYEEYGSEAAAQTENALGDVAAQAGEKLDAAVAQADKAIESAVEQADAAIGEAVESAVDGAKKGFFQSIKESVSSFFSGGGSKNEN